MDIVGAMKRLVCNGNRSVRASLLLRTELSAVAWTCKHKHVFPSRLPLDDAPVQSIQNSKSCHY
eukprot:scaffold254908_cov30-Tisochrysis_lutea.AAC.3